MASEKDNEPTLADAMERCEQLERFAEMYEIAGPHEQLGVIRRVLRRQALMLAMASGALRATPGLTPTGAAVVKAIRELNPVADEIGEAMMVPISEERPVPGPTPNPPVNPSEYAGGLG